MLDDHVDYRFNSRDVSGCKIYLHFLRCSLSLFRYRIRKQSFEFLVSLNFKRDSPVFYPRSIFFYRENDSSLKKVREVVDLEFIDLWIPRRFQRANNVLYSRYEGHRCRLSSHYQANLPVLLQIHRLRFDWANKPTSLLTLFFLPFHTFVNFPSPIRLDRVSARAQKFMQRTLTPLPIIPPNDPPPSKRPERILIPGQLDPAIWNLSWNRARASSESEEIMSRKIFRRLLATLKVICILNTAIGQIRIEFKFRETRL